jgi:hypothetical protein
VGRFRWGHTGAHIALDVFDDDDRVVDDNTDRKDKAE